MKRIRWSTLISSLIVTLLVLLVLTVMWGRYPRPGLLRWDDFRNDSLARALVLNLRLPRAVMAVLLGAVLAAAGTVLQTVLGNPLVEPGLLGVSQGAAFGAALSILLAGQTRLPISVSAAVFGLLGLALSWSLARRIRYGGSILRLILAGVVISALFSAGLGVLKYLADPRSELPEITFWLMGGLGSANWETVRRTAIAVLPVLVVLSVLRWRINLLSLDDRSAFALGSNPGRERLVLVVLAVVAVAVITAEAGIISWVGLLVPHVARKIVGADSSKALPLGMVLGGIFVLLCDTLARSLLTGEIPLGLITALFGALMFALMMTRVGVKS